MGDKSCGAFPDPMQVPERYLGPELPTCSREAGHRPPHRAERPLSGDDPYVPVILEWDDPEHFAEVMRDLESHYGRHALRMWVERKPNADELAIPPVSPPWLYGVPGPRGPLPEPVQVASLEEFQRVYGGPRRLADGGEFNADPSGPAFTVGEYGAVHSITREPIPSGWRGWPRRARLRVSGGVELLQSVVHECDRAYWRAEDAVWVRWQRARRWARRP